MEGERKRKETGGVRGPIGILYLEGILLGVCLRVLFLNLSIDSVCVSRWDGG